MMQDRNHWLCAFLRATMVYTCRASFVYDDQSLIELAGMQHERNNNRKYKVKFYSSAVIKETSEAVFCCLFA